MSQTDVAQLINKKSNVEYAVYVDKLGLMTIMFKDNSGVDIWMGDFPRGGDLEDVNEPEDPRDHVNYHKSIEQKFSKNPRNNPEDRPHVHAKVYAIVGDHTGAAGALTNKNKGYAKLNDLPALLELFKRSAR